MSDTGVFPKFYLRAVEDKPQSLEAGRPIFKEVEYVEILIAGDKNNRQDRKVTDIDMARWPKQYEAFKNEQEQPLEGTPVAQWPLVSVSKQKELLALNIKTVEALADLPDNGIDRLGMGARELVKKAQAYLKQAIDGSELARLVEQNEKLVEQNGYMQGQIEELKSICDDLQAQKPKAANQKSRRSN